MLTNDIISFEQLGPQYDPKWTVYYKFVCVGVLWHSQHC